VCRPCAPRASGAGKGGEAACLTGQIAYSWALPKSKMGLHTRHARQTAPAKRTNAG
jgi:hypothetical protein